VVELLRRLFNFQPYNLSRLKTRAIIRGNNALENTVPLPSYRIAKEGHPPPKASELEILAGFVLIRRYSRASALVFPKVISRLNRVKERNGL